MPRAKTTSKTTTRKTTAKKTTARKSPARKPAAKKTTASKAAPKKAVRKTTATKAAPKKTASTTEAVKLKAQPKSAIKESYNKSQVTTTIAEATGLSKKQVTGVMDELSTLIHRHLKKGGAGEFTMPGLAKFKVTRKPATKARKGVNPFTGEEMVFKAKPARNVVKVRPLKKVKEAAN